ncbi:MAG TPA: hypothetical protein VNZ53_04200 [Steroidobacteraceae bacterium]|jgi:hypothetical protein|nr:hypothetical protein [Steroidobacteraceae bacterium]
MSNRLDYLIAQAAHEAYACRARAMLARAYDDAGGVAIYQSGEAAWTNWYQKLNQMKIDGTNSSD